VSFGTVGIWQGWLLAAGAIAVAAALFFMKVRPPRVTVASLLLWRRVLDDRRERTLWERIRRAVSLAVTVLVALALALAALRLEPDAARGASAGGRTHIVVDTSWSMQARTGSGETRWERGVTRARQIAVSAGGLVSLATTSDGIVVAATTDRAVLDAALLRLRPSGGDAEPWLGSSVSSVHYISDGGTPRALPRGVVVHSVFEAAANVGITAFDVRPALTGSHLAEAYLEVANFAPAAQDVRVSVRRGATSLLDREVRMAPGERLRHAFPVPRGGEDLLSASVAADANALALDDHADAWIATPGTLTVALVGEDVAWLAPLFEGDPGVRAVRLRPADYTNGGERFDVLVFDRWEPANPPAAPALYFAPPSGRGGEESRPRWDVPGRHPVVRGVDPFTLGITRARSYAHRELTPVARSARGTPLVYVQEGPEHRRVVVTFGPDESNLTAVPAFPVLVGNAVEWLAGPLASGGRRPGPATFTGRVDAIEPPAGSELRLARLGGVTAALLRSPGLHRIRAGSAAATVPVNINDPQVSDLTRTTLPAGAAPVAQGRPTRPWWIYLALAAFVLVLLEWWTWVRRITV
jgi:hypothetical protein